MIYSEWPPPAHPRIHAAAAELNGFPRGRKEGLRTANGVGIVGGGLEALQKEVVG